ncbi:MAG: hypothetical protein H6Q77_299 [Gemmatimonadetes bacterium]|nr:hypothetical protein [Gemmatimonadota bacterium]
MKTTRTLYALALLAAPLLGTACKKAAPPPPPAETMAPPTPSAQPAVTKIELGSSVGADKRVLAPRSTFGVRDSIIASVYTENTAPNTVLTAKWTFQTGQTVDSTSQAVAASPGVTEFHIVKKTAWPAGRYKVEISLNGAPAGAQEFDVAK